jgi:hypothetical protein
MNEKKYNQITDEAYEHYLKWVGPRFQPISKEEFINKIKTDKEFSERWGLKLKNES